MSPPHRIVLRTSPLALGRSELAREWIVAARALLYGAALSSARSSGYALHGASLFLEWPRKSNQKEGHPCIRVLLRKTSLPPALLRGPSRRDIHVPSLLARHPCLASPCATPPLGLLKGIRDRVACKSLSKSFALFPFIQPDRRRESPLSGGRMESAWRGASGMDAARGLGVPAIKGHGWPLYAGHRNADGMREVERSETRMQGQGLLVPFGGAAIRAFAKRDSPSRAKPLPQPSTINSRDHHPRRQKLREQARSYESPLRNVRGNREVGPRPLPIKKTLSVCA